MKEKEFYKNKKIQMLKDQNIIKEVVFEQKKQTSILFSKFYRLLKSVKKQIEEEDYKKLNLRDFTFNQLKEAFHILDPVIKKYK